MVPPVAFAVQVKPLLELSTFLDFCDKDVVDTDSLQLAHEECEYLIALVNDRTCKCVEIDQPIHSAIHFT